jgi:chromosome segregation ATPase
MAELVKRLNAVEVPNNIFADRFAALADSISSDFEKLRSAILENAAAFTQSLSASVTSMGRVSNEITAIHQAITSARQELARVVTVATETANGTQQFTQSATAAVEAMDRFQKVTSQLATSLDELQDKLRTEGNAHARDMTRAVGDFKAIISDAKGDASQFTDAMVNSAKLLRDALADVANDK